MRRVGCGPGRVRRGWCAGIGPGVGSCWPGPGRWLGSPHTGCGYSPRSVRPALAAPCAPCPATRRCTVPAWSCAGTRCLAVAPVHLCTTRALIICFCRGRCGSGNQTFVQFRNRCSDWRRRHSATSSSWRWRGLILTWWIGCSSPPWTRFTGSAWSCYRKAPYDRHEVDDLEALLGHHGVKGLITGVRQRPNQPGQFPGNWVHLGVSTGGQWVHIKQSKHHRWSLDESQIHQYHLGGALHPHARWWEATEVPPRSVQLIEVGEGATVVSLVCEDLAQIDHVADLIRSVGPTIVVTPLLDGPQLSSRWSARYASVLADDPGSAVLTLTSYGMVQRSRPPGRNSSAVVALWKNPGQADPGDQPRGRRSRRSASAQADRSDDDGAARTAADLFANGSELFEISVYQVRAANAGSERPYDRTGSAAPPVLGHRCNSPSLAAGRQAVADALAFAPEQLETSERRRACGCCMASGSYTSPSHLRRS